MRTEGVIALIPTHSRFELVARAANSVHPLPVVIVDDSVSGSLPKTIETTVSHVVRTRGEEGFSSAVNQGLAYAREAGFDWVLLLNDDAYLEPGALQSLLNSRASDVGVLAPVLVEEEGVDLFGVRIRAWGRVHPRYRDRPGMDPEAVPGACMLIRSNGYFETAYQHGMEDFDFCLREKSEGRRIVLVSEARCRHDGGATLPRRSRVAQRHGLSGQLRLFDGGWRSPFVIGLAVAQVIRERGPADRFLGIWQGWRDWRNHRS